MFLSLPQREHLFAVSSAVNATARTIFVCCRWWQNNCLNQDFINWQNLKRCEWPGSYHWWWEDPYKAAG